MRWNASCATRPRVHLLPYTAPASLPAPVVGGTVLASVHCVCTELRAACNSGREERSGSRPLPCRRQQPSSSSGRPAPLRPAHHAMPRYSNYAECDDREGGDCIFGDGVGKGVGRVNPFFWPGKGTACGFDDGALPSPRARPPHLHNQPTSCRIVTS